jgi:hypothetical protein
MASERTEAFIREAPPAELRLYLALLELFQAMRQVTQEQRESACKAVAFETELLDVSRWAPTVD